MGSLAVWWSAVTVLQDTAACAGGAKDAAADAASRQQGRVLGRGRRSSSGRTARLRRGKTDVAGAVRLQLSFHPVSPTPQPYRCAGLSTGQHAFLGFGLFASLRWCMKPPLHH